MLKLETVGDIYEERSGRYGDAGDLEPEALELLGGILK